MKKIILLNTLFITFISYAKVENSKIKIDFDSPVHNINPDFLSFGLDTAQIVGSFWWDKEGKMEGGRGKNKVTPLNLKNKNLIKYTKALSPAYLRIGGSEADALYYNVEKVKKPNQFDSELTTKMIQEIGEFIKKTNTKLFFTLNQGPSTWNKKGKYQTTNLESFLKYISKNENIPLTFELGNEVFAYWAIFGINYQQTEEEYAKNFVTVKKILKKNNLNSKLAGPASAFWPIIGEPLGFFFGKIKNVIPKLKEKLDIVTWHYYPTQSFRCPLAIRRANKERFLDPDVLDEIKDFADEMVEQVHKNSPSTKIWLGETGSAQCGGEPEISPHFISSFWWLDQLGILAQKKHNVVIRHNLIGADYALLNPDASPRPDYYSSWMWKKFMGKKVFKTESRNSYLRAYSHCHPDKKNISVMLINIHANPINFELPFKNEGFGFYITTHNLYGQEYLINNGKILSLDELEHIKAKVIQPKSVSMQGHSIAFFKFPDLAKKCLD